MSALPPKADIGTQSWKVRFVPKADVNLLDDLVGAGDQRRRNGEAESCRCLEIDDKFDLRRLLYRQVCGLCSLQDFIHVARCATVLAGKIGSIAHESANFDMLAITINRRQTCLCCKVSNLPTPRIKSCVRRDEQTFNALHAQRRERRIKPVGSANLRRHEQDAERLGGHFGLTQLRHVQLVCGVNEQAEACEMGQHFTQQVDLLGGKHFCEVCKASHIAAGM